MRYRALGTTGIRVSELGFGCARIASLATRHPRSEVVATLAEAFERGVTLYDSADVYGQGDSERLLASVFRDRRDRIVLCTKAGLRLSTPQAAIRLLKPLLNPLLRRSASTRQASIAARERSERQCFEPRWLAARLHASLRRLRTDRVDVFLLHSAPASLGRLDEVARWLEAAQAAGLVRCYGVSCACLADAEHWLAVPGVRCLQVPLGEANLAAARPLLARAAAMGVGVIAREVLRDVLSGAAADRPAALRRAFSAVLAAPAVATALAGMGCRAHLYENVAAAEASDSLHAPLA